MMIFDMVSRKMCGALIKSVKRVQQRCSVMSVLFAPMLVGELRSTRVAPSYGSDTAEDPVVGRDEPSPADTMYSSMPTVVQTAVAAASKLSAGTPVKIGNVAKPATVQLGNVVKPATVQLGNTVKPATVQLSTVPQSGYEPVQLGSPVKPAVVQLGAQVKPATVQLGAQVAPQVQYMGAQVKPAVVQLGAQQQQMVTLNDGTRVSQEDLIKQVNGLMNDLGQATSNVQKLAATTASKILGNTLTANAAKIAERIKAASTPESALGEYLQGARNLKLAGGEAAYKALVETPSAAIGKVTGITVDKLGNVVTASRNLGLTPEMQKALEKTAGDNALLLSQFSAAQIDQMKQAYNEIEQRQQDGTRLVLKSLYDNAGLPTPLKLVPLASTDKNSAIAEMEWRAGKYSLNDVIPRIDASIHKELVLDDIRTPMEQELKPSEGADTG